jgi:hypothetical protein
MAGRAFQGEVQRPAQARSRWWVFGCATGYCFRAQRPDQFPDQPAALAGRNPVLDGALSAQLMSAEKASFSSSPASETPVTASLHQNLEIVDNYISLCENSVREEPENELAREYLYEAYQQKADLLAQLNER